MEKKLNSILRYAKQNIPYYRSYSLQNPLEDINDFPVIDKRRVRDAENEFISNTAERCRMNTFRTSGSTGEPMTVYKSTKDYYAQLRCLWNLRYKWHNVLPSDRSIRFVSIGPSFGNEVSLSINYPSGVLSIPVEALSCAWLESRVKIINDFRPRYIMGTSSQICLYISLLEKLNRHLPDSIVYIESVGEPLLNSQREYIENYSGINVTNYYGCTEIYGIAYSCRYGNMHLIDKNVYIEVMANGVISQQTNRKGRILLTGLNSWEQSFIRYDLGDIVTLMEGELCKCGNPSPIINVDMGRSYEIFEVNGQIYHSSVLYWYIEYINLLYGNCILQFKFRQRALDRFDVYLTLRENKLVYSKPIMMKLSEMLSKGFAGVYWAVIVNSDDSVWDYSGKFKYYERDF